MIGIDAFCRVVQLACFISRTIFKPTSGGLGNGLRPKPNWKNSTAPLGIHGDAVPTVG